MFTLLYTTDCNKKEYEKYSALEDALRARALAKECCYQNVYLLDTDNPFCEHDPDFTFGLPVPDPDELAQKEQARESARQEADAEWQKILKDLAPICKKYGLKM